jgi:hypothetical protein
VAVPFAAGRIALAERLRLGRQLIGEEPIRGLIQTLGSGELGQLNDQLSILRGGCGDDVSSCCGTTGPEPARRG